MYGLEKLTGACNLGCRGFWPIWGAAVKQYDDVPVEDVENMEPVLEEPKRPVWDDLKIGAPIVKTKIVKTGSQEKVTGSTPKLADRRDSKVSTTSSSQEVYEVTQMVTVV